MTTYKPILTDRTDILRSKRAYGIWYGASLGFLFALFTWGLDAFKLSQINSLHPWLKFAAGALLCTAAGGLTGWLAARKDKPILALLVWIVYGFFLAWLVVTLPTVIFPRLLTLLEPEIQQYLHYVYYPEFSTRIGVAFADRNRLSPRDLRGDERRGDDDQEECCDCGEAGWADRTADANRHGGLRRKCGSRAARRAAGPHASVEL